VAGYLTVFLGLLTAGMALVGRNQKLREASAVSLSAD
jgi:hypothetical protein